MLFNPCPYCSIGTIELSLSTLSLSSIISDNKLLSCLCNSNFKFNFFYFLKYYQNIGINLLEFS